MKYPIIGVAGKARAGKDTAANFLVASLGGYRYGFADPLRAMLMAGLGMDLTEPYWQERKELKIAALGKSPRELLQTLGTEWGRQLVHPEIWLTVAQQKLMNNGPGMIISDVRFDNEANWIRKHGGLVLHVTRPSPVEVAGHISEHGIKPHESDKTIHNSGTLEEYQQNLKVLFEVL